MVQRYNELSRRGGRTPSEWDERKRRSNLTKHRVDFEDVQDFDWDRAVVEAGKRGGEQRFRATGYIGERLRTVVYTHRGENVRVISLRRAKKGERERYAAAQAE